MTGIDNKVLFTSLGFLAVVIQGKGGDEGAAKAQEFARLIEEFCRVTLPADAEKDAPSEELQNEESA